MIRDWSDFRTFVRADMISRGDTRPLRAFIFDPVARVTVLMRLNEYLINTGKPLVIRLIPLLWFRRLCVRLGFSIGPNIFDKGVAIVHYGLLVIDPSTRIGRNCRIHAGVNIGGAAQFVDPAEIHKYSPRIGHNVYIGPGAKLYGPIVIGDDCVIGANAVVTKSFPEPGLTLAGIPARVIGTGGSGERVRKGAEEAIGDSAAS
jgi:serine O-acetyltransferase